MNRLHASAAFVTLLCFSLLGATDTGAAELKKREYAKHALEMGVILMDVGWGRRWNCAGYENAQLDSLKFLNTDRDSESSKYTEVEIKSPPRLSAANDFDQYGFLVKPGTYAFVGWSIKAARSVSDVGYIRAGEAELIDAGQFLGGTMEIGAGETVYVGNFFLDCHESPIPWRYYTVEENLAAHFQQFHNKFRFIDPEVIKIRLMKTELFGNSVHPYVESTASDR
jgi:hypothetical protein